MEHPTLNLRTVLMLGGLAVAIMAADAFIFGIGHVDTETYITQIEGWRHGLTFAVTSNPWDAFRAFKPLYGILGLMLGFLPPLTVLLVVNAAFLIGLSFVAYLFLAQLGFSKSLTWLGTFWIVTAYPALGLGFAAGTDISGWFFCIATIAIALYAIERQSDRLFILASLVGFLGATGKETGVLGLVFAGTYLLLAYPKRGLRPTIKSLAALSIPFLALEGVLFYAIHIAGLPNFFDWVSFSDQLYGDIYTFKFFFGAELATFNVLWLPILLGAYALIARRVTIEKKHMLQLIALFIAALPILEWHTFTDRILYIQCIVLIPLALYGIQFLEGRYPNTFTQRYVRIVLYAIPFIASAFMLSIEGHDGLYRIAHYILGR